MTDFFVTCYRAYPNSEDGGVGVAAGVNAAETAYYGAQLKEVNYLIDPIGQIKSDLAPAHRDNPLINHQLPETTLQIAVGAKQIPELPMKGRRRQMYLAMALGLEGKREGFLNPYSWQHNKGIWSTNLEIYTGTYRFRECRVI